MKKFSLIGLALAGSLVLAGCAPEVEYKGPRPDRVAPVSGVSEADQDLNNRSSFNDKTYCNGDTYVPLPNNEFQCEDQDSKKHKVAPSKKSSAITAPKFSAPKAAPKPASKSYTKRK